LSARARWRFVPAPVLAGIGAIAFVAAAQAQPCEETLEANMVPANVEWTWWLGAGGGAELVSGSRDRGIAMGRVGVGATIGAGERLFGDYQLRLGPWLGGEGQIRGALAEGGLELLLAPIHDPEVGAYSIRVAGGYGVDDHAGAAQLSITVTGGLRAVPQRYADGGACDGSWENPKPIAFAHGVRLFATWRAASLDDPRHSIVGGVEMSPSLFLPPHKRYRWLGGYPR
jgi:hypothetical protein